MELNSFSRPPTPTYSRLRAALEYVSLLRIGAFCLLAVVGCGKPTEPQNAVEKHAANDLKLFGAGYKMYLNNNHYPPQTPDDLRSVISSDRPIEFDRYHIIWGVDLKSITQGRTVLAYEAAVPETGGMVLFHDGSVERVSADGFRQLPKAASAKRPVERPADVTFTPAEYFAEFAKLNTGMARKYEGKVIELKGVVGGLGRLSGRPELLVISPGKEYEDVRCFMPEGEEFWAKVAKGQEVTVKGQVRDPQGYPMLINCGLAGAGPGAGVTVTAEELAREVADDGGAAMKKYAGKSFILTGEVVSVSAWSTFRGVQLKGTAGQPVECVFGADAERDKKFVPGAKLKLYAEFDGNGTRLTNCELITK